MSTWTYMHIKGQGHSMTLVQIHSDNSQHFLFFFLGTARLIEAKFHLESPWDGGTKVCTNGPGHMTNMAAMPIYGKKLKKSSLEPKGRWPWNLVCNIEYSSTTKFVQLRLILTYFTTRSKLVPFLEPKDQWPWNLVCSIGYSSFYYQICSNDDTGLILIYLTARSNLVPFVYVWENA